ncbi:MAG: ribonuclease P protein component [Gemmataceae bacterium]|nr:ribonuclease P protein component [Gemmataceae bacterium]MDW8242497.1 ribonuclease P protein component [Thermogemmata sp.]
MDAGEVDNLIGKGDRPERRDGPEPSELRRLPQEPRRYTFPPHLRLKRAAEFERCFARRQSAADNVLIVYVCENGSRYPRLGCVVSRKCGRAVRRNRYKRLLREAFRLLQHDLPAGIDYVVLPRPGSMIPSLAAIQRSLLRLARRAVRQLQDKGWPPQPSPPQAASS